MRKFYCEFSITKTYNFEFECKDDDDEDNIAELQLDSYINSPDFDEENFIDDDTRIDNVEEIED